MDGAIRRGRGQERADTKSASVGRIPHSPMKIKPPYGGLIHLWRMGDSKRSSDPDTRDHLSAYRGKPPSLAA